MYTNYPYDPYDKSFFKYLDLVEDQSFINSVALDISEDFSSHSVKFEENGIVIYDEELSWHSYLNHKYSNKDGTKTEVRQNPYFLLMVKNFIKIRKYRFNLIEKIKNANSIKHFELTRDTVPVATKSAKGRLLILNHQLFEECLRVPTKGEIFRELFFMYRTEQYYGGKSYSFNVLGSWKGKLKNDFFSPEPEDHMGTVPYKRGIYEREVRIFDEDRQNDYWAVEIILLRDLIKKQGLNSFSPDIPWEQNHCVTVLEINKFPWIHPVLEYLKGERTVDEVGITPLNANQVLTTLKMLDLAINMNNGGRVEDKFLFSKSSFELRTKVLQLSSPHMKTIEAYSMTLHEGKMRDGNYWLKSSSWCTERVAMHAKIIANQYILARSLSDELKYIRAIRGNTAAGKSTLAPLGTLNPDDFKAFLKKMTGRILNTQVHNEGSAIFKRFAADFINKTDFAFIVDKRLDDEDDINKYVLDAAKGKMMSAELIDLEVPLSTSLKRVLTRDPFGKDPCPSLEDIVGGFVNVRKNRPAIIESIKTTAAVKKYELFCFAKRRNITPLADRPNRYEKTLVAIKAEAEFFIVHQDLYEKCIRTPSQPEIETTLAKIITSEYINKAISRGDVRGNDRAKLEKWENISLGEAVRLHSQGLDKPC